MAHNWRPSSAISFLRTRAEIVRRIRTFFDERGVFEICSPVLSPCASAEPSLRNLATAPAAGGGPWYLRTSPESAMKRLLACGSGDIYQLGPVFRAEESGRLHLVEFTLLEWYRLGFDHGQLMDEVAALLHALGFERPLTRLRYRDLFAQHLGVDPHGLATAELAALARALPVQLSPADFDDHAILFDALYAAVLEPALAAAGAVLLHDFPRELRAYARLSSDAQAVAERFELIIDGVEIANGYHEVIDADEQSACFARENDLRIRRGLAPVGPDAGWLAALRQGLPPCAGVALGIERLLLALYTLPGIAAATAFAWELD